MEVTAASPANLRQAARHVIIEGADGLSTVERLTSTYWTQILLAQFKQHRINVLGLSSQFPPEAICEIRLLEHCLEGVALSPDDQALVRAAIRLSNGAEVVNADDTYLNGAIVVVRRSDDWMAHVEGDTRIWATGNTQEESIGRLIKSHPKDVAKAIRRLT